MAQNRPSKRARFGGAFYDPIPFVNDFSVVHAQDTRLVRVGNEFLNVPVEREPQHAADRTWSEASTWLSPDDPQFALDPNGDWYDEAVECDIMAQDESAGFVESSNSSAKKKKRVRSKASVSLARSKMIFGLIFFLKSVGPTFCGGITTVKLTSRRLFAGQDGEIFAGLANAQIVLHGVARWLASRNTGARSVLSQILSASHAVSSAIGHIPCTVWRFVFFFSENLVSLTFSRSGQGQGLLTYL